MKLMLCLETKGAGAGTPMKTGIKVLGKEALQQSKSHTMVPFNGNASRGLITPASEKALYFLDMGHVQLLVSTKPAPASLLLFYIYASYLTPAESWANLLTPSGSHSLRNTAYDAVSIALLVEEGHKHDILSTGYDGMDTYFASIFSFGSSHQNWKAIKTFCDSNNLMFVPRVCPGYIDTHIRPWNNHNAWNRVNGKYYETALQAALTVRPEIVSITSFNEWQEGTQIGKAVPKEMPTGLYLDCLPHQPSMTWSQLAGGQNVSAKRKSCG